MRQIPYAAIPSVHQFQHDSSVRLAIRKNDHAVARIDELLTEYHQCSGSSDLMVNQRGLVLCDLFLTIEHWFGLRQSHPGKVEEGRLPAMRGLFDKVVAELGTFFADAATGAPATPSQVGAKMKLFTANGMSVGGYRTDRVHGMRQFDKEQLCKYLLWFSSGLAYQIPWWSTHPGNRRVLAESRRADSPMARGNGNASTPDWGPFVMTLDRKIYMTKHSFDLDIKATAEMPITTNNFHSSYNGGNRVAMAGTIGIFRGQIRGIRMDSGHYKPGLHNLNAFLWALKMYQVDLAHVLLYSYDNKPITVASNFLSSGRSWEQFKRGAIAEQTKLDDAKLEREMRWPKNAAPAPQVGTVATSTYGAMPPLQEPAMYNNVNG